MQLILLCLCIIAIYVIIATDTNLVSIPTNNSRLHYIKNDTNCTSSILLFNQDLNLPDIAVADYFLCYQIFSRNYRQNKLQNEKARECFARIPNHPFNITDLVDGVYHIQSSLLSVSQSDMTKIKVIKEELTVFYVREMIDFHATY